LQLAHLRVAKYRNILGFGWIEVSDVSAFEGQNEAGKSSDSEGLWATLQLCSRCLRHLI
jgi:hypothetical protein